MGFLKISWDNAEKYDDCIITYLLYKEGKILTKALKKPMLKEPI